MGLLTPGDGSTWNVCPGVVTTGGRTRPHMVALIEDMELPRAVRTEEIAVVAEPGGARPDSGEVTESAA